jgi:hypothetical protein
VFRAVIFGKQRKLFADRMVGLARILGERKIAKGKLDCDKCQANIRIAINRREAKRQSAMLAARRGMRN